MNYWVRKLVYCVAFVCISAMIEVEANNGIDLVVFSKDRPLQLYAFLESCDLYVTGLEKSTIVYNASSDNFEKGYQEVKKTFPAVTFVRQFDKADFKEKMLKAVFGSEAAYILFAVDDIVLIDAVDLCLCARMLEQHKAYGFYLRLGKDITECYMNREHTGVPHSITQVASDVYRWQFGEGRGDWSYPNTVDMTLYRKKALQKALFAMNYTTPNIFECLWAKYAKKKNFGLCFGTSKIVNMPLNIVQIDFRNRHSSSFDPNVLLAKFNEGFKIDIRSLHKLPHAAPHVDHVPVFIGR